MPVLRYWDTTTGAWVDLGGTASPEVYVGNDPPPAGAGQVLWVDTDDSSPGIAGQRWSPEYTILSSSMAPATQSAADPVITHNLGAKGIIVGHVEDGSWSHQLGWRMSINTATQVSVTWYNPGPATAQGLLRFRMLY